MAESRSSTSPPRSASFQIRPPLNFLPLSEAILSPRNSALPALIQSRSAANLHAQNLQQRRLSILRGGEDSDAENDGQRLRLEDEGLATARRGSLGPEVLLTPQMRSMRLIGNSNPRYQW